ncbi:hypothetical protein [Caulobacter mirabilis]|uniref:DUF1570 domain-containing protein n=1 Tax=Caulobacter mirabilis TaxID=69666 RepID=A0A2D2AVH7_9CAUL|nr:hypothetical protein [Caulobacter mirabilis]ATQ41971.1 hypothetical protein CSW64_05865 [Caulobacter mirabilis]
MAVVAAAALCAPGLAQAKWLKAESPRFIVYGESSERSLREYAEKLEIFDSVLRYKHGMDLSGAPPRKLEIYLVADNEGLREVEPALGSGIAGFYSPGMGDIFAMAIRDREPDFVVLHEYAHHFMLQYFPYGYPAWLVEGYAEYFAQTVINGDKVEVGRPNNVRSYSLLNAHWLPFKDLLTKRTSDLKTGEMDSFYAQSWALTHYLMSDPARNKQLDAYMKAVGAGGDPAKTMEAVTGQDLDALQKAVRRYAGGRLAFASLTRKGFAPPQIKVEALPSSADDLLLAYLRMRSGMSKDEGEVFVKTYVRPRAAKHPGDRLAELALAYGEVWFADRAAGEAVLKRMIAADPKDADALRILGVSRVIEAGEDGGDVRDEMQEGGKLLARAHAARPGDYRTLYYYAISRQIEPDYPSDNTLNALSAAFDLAPQVPEVRIMFARALMLEKEWEEARVVLMPLANSPHGGGAAEAARKTLEQVDGEIARVKGKAAP